MPASGVGAGSPRGRLPRGRQGPSTPWYGPSNGVPKSPGHGPECLDGVIRRGYLSIRAPLFVPVRGPAPGGGVRDVIDSEARDTRAAARPSGRGLRPSAPYGLLPDLPPSPAARHGALRGRRRLRRRLLRGRVTRRSGVVRALSRPRPPDGPERPPGGLRRPHTRRAALHRTAAAVRDGAGTDPVGSSGWDRAHRQGAYGVTGITEQFRPRAALTPFLQSINLVCAIALPSKSLRKHPPHLSHSGRAGQEHPSPGAQKRSRWTRRSPARSTTYPCCVGMGPVGAGTCRMEL